MNASSKNKLSKNKLSKNRLSKKYLRLMFSLFFLTLIIPCAILSYNAYEKLRWETFHQYQLTAQSLAMEINSSLNDIINKESARTDTDYSFLVLEGDPKINFLQRSVLSRYPVESDLPGIIGYFQIDQNGLFSSPLLPTESKEINQYGISDEDKLLRKQLVFNLQNILSQNQLVSSLPSSSLKKDNQTKNNSAGDESDVSGGLITEGSAKQQISENEIVAMTASRNSAAKEDKIELERSLGFSKLESPAEQNKISEDLGKKQGYENSSLNEYSARQQLLQSNEYKLNAEKRAKRKEINYLPQKENRDLAEVSVPPKDENIQPSSTQNINLFESELEPFRFSLLKSGHFVAYRQVWRNGSRLIQGAILSVDDFFKQAIKSRFERSPLIDFTRLSIAYAGNVLASFPNEQMSYRARKQAVNDELLLSTNLTEPFGQISLIFQTTDMPSGESGDFIIMIVVLLVLALIFGTYSLYRLTYRQTLLAQQHQDFISSVSHELKTPITSIKMYGEILLQGWATPTKKQEYYQFIYSEAERLSRLIANILQISEVSRDSLKINMKELKVADLSSISQSKIDSQIIQSGFEYSIQTEPAVENSRVNIDMDAFIQILINLVDNAIKYSAKSDVKKIEIQFGLEQNKYLKISVRDHGPGIAKQNINKIFELFYRIGNEMTRESKGTGIGLALVKELTLAMNGQVKVSNQQPGVEFSVLFPLSLNSQVL